MAGTRLWIMMAIALPLIILAPFTYKLTKVYRSPLPIEEIEALNAASVSFDLPIYFWYRTSERMKEIQDWMKDIPDFEHHPDGQLNYVFHHELMDERDVDRVSDSDAHERDEYLHAFKVRHGGDSNAESDYSFFFDCDATGSTEKWIMGKYRHAWTRNCDQSSLVQLQQLFLSHLFPSPGHIRAETTFAPRYRLTFSLLNEDPHKHAAHWTFPHLAEQYLNGFVHKLSILADFTLDSQILHYANLSRTMYYDELDQVRCITTNDLQQFKSTNDWLTTTILEDQERNLNFLAYVPSPEQFPLIIQSSEGSSCAFQDTSPHNVAFEIPGWGGVAIHQRPAKSGNSAIISSDEFQATMGYFIAHCRNLFGLRNGASGESPTDYADFLISKTDGICDWELDIMTRSWLSRFVSTTVQTLKSIAKLVVTMPQMSVLDRIRLNVNSAMDLIDQVSRLKKVSITEYPIALALAREAMRKADAAYYDPTMVPQLYFPEEHIYAVYLPLLFPLTLPLLAGMLREWKRYKEKRGRKAKQAAAAKEKEE